MEYKKKTKRVPANCTNCGKEFLYKVYDIGIYKSNCCSRKCSNALKVTKIEVNCKQCGKIFSKVKSQCEKSPNHFCTKSCAATYNNTHKEYGYRRSKLEMYLEQEIKNKYDNLILECNSKTAIESELDFYFPEINLAIELNGIIHFEPIYGVKQLEKVQNNDKRKVIACYEKGIELAIIDSSNCKYLNENAKNKFKKIIFDLLDDAIERRK